MSARCEWPPTWAHEVLVEIIGRAALRLPLESIPRLRAFELVAVAVDRHFVAKLVAGLVLTGNEFELADKSG